MKLLTAEIRSKIPSLYTQEHVEDKIVFCKFFCPWSNWTWFATEGSQEHLDDFTFFGYVVGLEREWGYFLLSELQALRGPGGLTIERDLSFKPAPFSQVIAQFLKQRGL